MIPQKIKPDMKQYRRFIIFTLLRSAKKTDVCFAVLMQYRDSVRRFRVNPGFRKAPPRAVTGRPFGLRRMRFNEADPYRKG